MALIGTDLDKIKINLEAIQLWFPVDTIYYLLSRSVHSGESAARVFPTREQRISFYQQLLKRLKDEGFVPSYQIVDCEYRRYRAATGEWPDKVIYWMSFIWWNFGYAQERVFLISLAFWLFASAVNLRFYHRLRHEVYDIPALRESNARAKWFVRCGTVMLYTAYFYFGIKISIERFQKGFLQKHPFLFSWLMFTYVFGLVCLGFIANIVFTR